MVIVGAPHSINSQQLRNVARAAGCHHAVLVQRAADLDLAEFQGVRTLGISAGASAPEVLVEEVLDLFGTAFDLTLETSRTADETVEFALPRQLRAGPIDANTISATSIITPAEDGAERAA